MKKNKPKAKAPTENMSSIQGRLDELLQQGRRLRQQIESISADVDFPLTRDSDGDPRLRKDNPSRPEPLRNRQHDRAADRPRARPADRRRK